MENCLIQSPIKISNSIISTNSEIIVENNESEEKILLLGEGTKIIL